MCQSSILTQNKLGLYNPYTKHAYSETIGLILGPVPERLPSNKQAMMSLQTSKLSSIQITCKKNKKVFNRSDKSLCKNHSRPRLDNKSNVEITECLLTKPIALLTRKL